MKVCNLASGSKGNCTYIGTENIKILLDAGKNITYIVDKLKEIDVNIKEIDYIIISHIHSDHISALKPLLKKSKAFLCVSKKIFDQLEEFQDYDKVLILEDEILLKDIKIKSFRSSHDSPDSRNFVLSNNDVSLAYITDTGYINQKNFNILYNLDIYLFECNHDIEMLENGPYPKWLKARVLSDEGHLSNNAAGFYLSKLIGPKTKEVMLIHLSETNNTPNKALNTVLSILKEYDVKFDNIYCATQEEMSKEIVL